MFYNNLAKNGTKVIENLVTSVGYDITGYSEDLIKDPTFWEVYETWRIERGLNPEIPTSLRLVYIMGYTMYMRNVINTIQKKHKLKTQETQTEIINDIVDEDVNDVNDMNIDDEKNNIDLDEINEIVDDEKNDDEKKSENFLDDYNF